MAHESYSGGLPYYSPIFVRISCVVRPWDHSGQFPPSQCPPGQRERVFIDQVTLEICD